MFKISREEARSLEAGSTWEKETGNAGGAPAWISNGRRNWFYHTNLWSCGRRAKRAGCGRVRSRYICFRHKLSAVRQGRQRRDAVAAGEDKLGRSTEGRLYPSVRCTFGEIKSLAVEFLNRSYAACAYGRRPRRWPPAVNITIIQAINRHKREVYDFACGIKSKSSFVSILYNRSTHVRRGTSAYSQNS
jgi:hypothetical protein